MLYAVQPLDQILAANDNTSDDCIYIEVLKTSSRRLIIQN